MSPALAGRFLSTVPPGKSAEVVVHVHDGILLSHKKESLWVSSNEVDELEPITQSEVSQKEKDKYHILTHIYGI